MSACASCDSDGEARRVRLCRTGEDARGDLETSAFLKADGASGRLRGLHGCQARHAALAILGLFAGLLVVGSISHARLVGSMRGTQHRGDERVELQGDEACHTASPGEACHALVRWTMQMAARAPDGDWAGLGITPASTEHEVQEALHKMRQGSDCPRPCPLLEDAMLVNGPVTSTTLSTRMAASGGRAAAPSDASSDYERAMAEAAAAARASVTEEPHAAAAEGLIEQSESQQAEYRRPVGVDDHRDSAPAAMSAANCGVVEDSVYLPGNDLRTVPNVQHPEECCQACHADGNCSAWTWGRRSNKSSPALPHQHSMCYLKGRRPLAALTRVMDPDFASGWKESSAVADWSTEPSLLCATRLPGGSESSDPTVRLLALQYELRAGIFACNEYMLFGQDVSREVVPGIWPQHLRPPTEHWSGRSSRAPGAESKVIDATISKVEGKLSFWRSLIDTGRFRHHTWTVRVDADAVLFPSRLAQRMTGRTEGSEGVVVTPCEGSPSRALQVLSQKAVNSLAIGWQRCLDNFAQTIPRGAVVPAEDELLDACLAVLRVGREPERLLLLSGECEGAPDLDTACSNQSFAAFHPFRDTHSFKQCVQEARSAP